MIKLERWINCNESYDGRNKMMAKFIKPNTSVLDLGAGLLTLKKYLPYGCIYQSVDLAKREEGTIICDFNKNEFPPPKEYDYVVCSGLLEYIYDLPYFLNKIKGYSSHFVISYGGPNYYLSLDICRKIGWAGLCVMLKLVKLFLKNGLVVKDICDCNGQLIFYLEKRSISIQVVLPTVMCLWRYFLAKCFKKIRGIMGPS